MRGEGNRLQVPFCVAQRASSRGSWVFGCWEQGVTAASVSPKPSAERGGCGDSRVKEERGTKAAEMLLGEEMSADSYLGTRRYQNP